jgi:UDP-N-acetylglucosamine--N-acetylmuramyl-(pentapeptide) pyrophosphoryl-undecaprenol N-acetylglucosamine transferase
MEKTLEKTLEKTIDKLRRSLLAPHTTKLDRSKLRPKIYISVSSEGFGHSSRAIAIAREFGADEILVGSYGYAYEKLKQHNVPAIKIPQELKLVGAHGSFDVGKTILKNHNWILNFNQLIQYEIDVIEDYGATCIVADGRLAPVMAADKVGLPCVVVTNQSAFYPFFEKDSALVKIFGRSFEWVMRTWLSSAEEIVIPDFPPPSTVCLPNLSTNFKVMKRQRFVGPLVSWHRREIETYKPVTKKPYIVITLGGHAYRKPLFETVLQVAEMLHNVQFDIFTTFEAEKVPVNVNIKGLVPFLAPYLKAADLIITQAGHSTAMEILTMGKPALIVPDKKQIEQENNSRRLCELGVSTQMKYDELSVNNLAQRIQMMLESSCYAEAAENMAEIAEQINGTKQAEKVLRDYSTRLMAY